MAQTAQDEFEAVKKQFRKADGRSYYHIVQAFAPDDPLDFDTAHEIGLKFAKYFKGYQCVVVTHMNTAHIHNHIIMNSVNFETGQKFHQSAREMQQAKEYSNQLCREYGLSFTESKADPFRIPAWKKRLCRTIKEAMENCATREEFIAFMAEYGYKVRWEANQKYITYTTPENVRCRDNKLFDQTLLRSSMEAYFDMGGCEYLESRIDATEYGELLPTVDDAVCGFDILFRMGDLFKCLVVLAVKESIAFVKRFQSGQFLPAIGLPDRLRAFRRHQKLHRQSGQHRCCQHAADDTFPVHIVLLIYSAISSKTGKSRQCFSL